MLRKDPGLCSVVVHVAVAVNYTINSLQPIGNGVKKHKSLYKVLTLSIKPHINSYGLMGAHDTI